MENKINYPYEVDVWSESDDSGISYWDSQESDNVSTAILKGDFKSLYTHIKNIGLLDDLDRIILTLVDLGVTQPRKIADLGAGTMWLSAELCNRFSDSLDKLYVVDYSNTNIFQIGPSLLDYKKVKPDKIVLCKGSFYDLRLPDSSVDIVSLSQAFHHADNPNLLLSEMRRVLKPNGVAFMIGELHIEKHKLYLCYINFIISVFVSRYLPKWMHGFGIVRKFVKEFNGQTFKEIYFPPDPIYGDYYYSESEYRTFFKQNGFKCKKVKSKLSNHLAFIISKEG
jgi:ubiquinone/menaquinone biosynthesis C-methylase UbiE